MRHRCQVGIARAGKAASWPGVKALNAVISRMYCIRSIFGQQYRLQRPAPRLCRSMEPCAGSPQASSVAGRSRPRADFVNDMALTTP